MNNSLNIGTILNDKWVILEFLGKGGMGEVYRVHQINLNRDVAIKVISKEWLQSCSDNEEELEIGLQRFHRELQAMAQVRHPNILQIFDHGAISIKEGEEDLCIKYIVMEYIPGNTLRATMSKEGFEPEENLTKAWLSKYFFPILDGVEAMHKLSIIHRDLKPENVLIDGNIPKIIDFGLARSYRLRNVTQSMDTKGTLAYMSPEHFYDFKNADQQTDVYSLGKILFEAIAGRISPKAKPFKNVCLKDPANPFFQELDQIIQYATAENKEERMESVEQLHKALINTITNAERKNASNGLLSPKPFSPIHYPKWIWTAVTLTLVSVALMTVWHLVGDSFKATDHAKEDMVKERSANVVEHVRKISATQTRSTDDGATLFLINGGEVRFPDNFGSNAGKLEKVDSFFMDEAPVTNQQYVEFLNKIISKIRVEKGVVVGSNDEIWLLLGEIMEGYEPIQFQKDKFQVTHPMHGACPVLRVTGYGAAAYAQFYGKRLPSKAEWLYAVIKGKNLHEKASDDTFKSEILPAPVLLFTPNANDIRGLNRHVKEWGLRSAAISSSEKQAEYVILGKAWFVTEKGSGSPIPTPVRSQPWEAFKDVGFRCIMSVTNPP